MIRKKRNDLHLTIGEVSTGLVRRYFSHDVGRDSAALTYYLLFAMFPLLVFFSTLLGALDIDVESTIAILEQLAPAELAEVIGNYLGYVSEHGSRELLWFSLLCSIWFPMRATNCLMHSLRKAYGQSGPESMIQGQLRTLAFTLLLLVTILVTILLSTVGRRALEFVSARLSIPTQYIDMWSYMRFVLLGLLLFVLLVPLYMLALGQRRPVRELAPGVLSSLVAWMGLSMAYAYYVEHFAHYTELYGSIEAIVVVLLWLYMSGTVLIMGAEVSAVIHERRQCRKEDHTI